ncbi:hypothetical protein [Psittacicella hinzii]|uniref:Uncharacterized protein n=1 Tax=Psittacicella hinzii TaxID=2028575 RepID=A0A3A1YP24_9GAMM|nr:hypothetical protein [Psittacicella hinzii]RIY39301.1 hypothetical protein CKF58_02350 [Psittacicella hinzii]
MRLFSKFTTCVSFMTAALGASVALPISAAYAAPTGPEIESQFATLYNANKEMFDKYLFNAKGADNWINKQIAEGETLKYFYDVGPLLLMPMANPILSDLMVKMADYGPVLYSENLNKFVIGMYLCTGMAVLKYTPKDANIEQMCTSLATSLNFTLTDQGDYFGGMLIHGLNKYRFLAKTKLQSEVEEALKGLDSAYVYNKEPKADFNKFVNIVFLPLEKAFGGVRMTREQIEQLLHMRYPNIKLSYSEKF